MARSVRTLVNSLVLIAGLALAGHAAAQPSSDASWIRSGGTWTQVRYETFAPYPEARSVRMFVDPGAEKRKAGATLEPAQGYPMSPAQRAYFEGSIMPYAVVGEDRRNPPKCFVPHHFFRYFDAKGQKVGEVAVCLCCSGVTVESAPGLVGPKRGVKFDRPRMESLVTSMGYQTHIDCGWQP